MAREYEHIVLMVTAICLAMVLLCLLVVAVALEAERGSFSREALDALLCAGSYCLGLPVHP